MTNTKKLVRIPREAWQEIVNEFCEAWKDTGFPREFEYKGIRVQIHTQQGFAKYWPDKIVETERTRSHT